MPGLHGHGGGYSGRSPSIFSMGTPFRGSTPPPPRRSRRGGLGPDALRLLLAADYDVDDMSDLIVNQLHDTYMEEEAQPHPISTRTLRSLQRIRGSESRCGEESCSICLDAYEKRDSCIRLPCEHTFHATCVERWFQAHHTCPSCRHKLPEQTPQEELELARERSEEVVRSAIHEGGAALAACCPGDPCAVFSMVEAALASDRLTREAEEARLRRANRRMAAFGYHNYEDDDSDTLYPPIDDDELLEQLLHQLAATEARVNREVRQRQIMQREAPIMILPNGQPLDSVDEATLRNILDELGVEHDEFDDIDDLRILVSIIVRESFEPANSQSPSEDSSRVSSPTFR